MDREKTLEQNQKVLALLKKWVDEGDEKEQTETYEYLKSCLELQPLTRSGVERSLKEGGWNQSSYVEFKWFKPLPSKEPYAFVSDNGVSFGCEECRPTNTIPYSLLTAEIFTALTGCEI